MTAGGVCTVNIHTFHGVLLLVYYDGGAAWRVRGPARHRIQRQDYAFGLLQGVEAISGSHTVHVILISNTNTSKIVIWRVSRSGMGGEYEAGVFQLLRCVLREKKFAASLNVVGTQGRLVFSEGTSSSARVMDTCIIRPSHGREPSFDRPAAGCSGGGPLRRDAAKQRRDWARTGLLGFPMA